MNARRKAIKNPHILHYTDKGRYLCNQAVEITNQKVAKTEGRVTCKNCLKILKYTAIKPNRKRRD